ncbi:hypothetical protein EVAR_20185_1 [Eumeta japonica]|uniref:Uncharacterized protein n=1 Tax=Eumeta variegata TaxID=151549 RepID=A0A4C1UV39_EUMVA|nr:hypothetical protein EVAR_20185_1 [Eumeta japonica]
MPLLSVQARRTSYRVVYSPGFRLDTELRQRKHSLTSRRGVCRPLVKYTLTVRLQDDSISRRAFTTVDPLSKLTKKKPFNPTTEGCESRWGHKRHPTGKGTAARRPASTGAAGDNAGETLRNELIYICVLIRRRVVLTPELSFEGLVEQKHRILYVSMIHLRYLWVTTLTLHVRLVAIALPSYDRRIAITMVVVNWTPAPGPSSMRGENIAEGRALSGEVVEPYTINLLLLSRRCLQGMRISVKIARRRYVLLSELSAVLDDDRV